MTQLDSIFLTAGRTFELVLKVDQEPVFGAVWGGTHYPARLRRWNQIIHRVWKPTGQQNQNHRLDRTLIGIHFTSDA